MSKILPLQLKDLIYPAISVEAVPMGQDEYSKIANATEFDPEALSIGFRFEHEDASDRASAGMSINTKDSGVGDGAPYIIKVKAFAVFNVPMPEANDTSALRVRRYAAAAALMGAIREQIATLTSRGPWGTAWLPLGNLEAIAEPPQANAEKITKPAAKKAAAAKKAK
jgi:hypothetical protein